jgi:hypothetical protein
MSLVMCDSRLGGVAGAGALASRSSGGDSIRAVGIGEVARPGDSAVPRAQTASGSEPDEGTVAWRR